jgi:hypothetical protein
MVKLIYHDVAHSNADLNAYYTGITGVGDLEQTVKEPYENITWNCDNSNLMKLTGTGNLSVRSNLSIGVLSNATVLVSDSNKNIVSSSIMSSELASLAGVTSNLQGQINDLNSNMLAGSSTNLQSQINDINSNLAFLLNEFNTMKTDNGLRISS